MFNEPIVWGLGLFILIWLGGLSFLLLRTIANYNRLTKGASSKTLTELLNELLQREDLTREELRKVLEEIKELRAESKSSFKKLGLVRFNPFADTGGDQSFTLALLNEKDSGIVVTSLYARTGVRWYIKTIKNGKGMEHDLSKEEKSAIEKATVKN